MFSSIKQKVLTKQFSVSENDDDASYSIESNGSTMSSGTVRLFAIVAYDNAVVVRPQAWVGRPRTVASSAVNQSLYNFSEEEQMIKETGDDGGVCRMKVNLL